MSSSASPYKDQLYDMLEMDGSIDNAIVMEMWKYISDYDAEDILKTLGYDEEGEY